MLIKRSLNISVLIVAVFLYGCASSLPPHKAEDVCAIFNHNNSWYWDAVEAERKWGVPVHVAMSIIHQESSFRSGAKPPRGKILWVIPWKRPTSAYGYSQAVDSTWSIYEKENNRYFAYRNSFSDSVDFIGWYAHRAHKRVGLSKKDAAQLYLSYHEGIGGYSRKTYTKKKWLLDTARKVKLRSRKYNAQLHKCRDKIPSKPWYKFF